MNNMTVRAPSYPYVNAGGIRQLVGFGSSIYSTTDGITFTRVHAGGVDAGQCSALVSFIDTNSTIIHFAAFSSIAASLTGTARYQKSTDNGATWANGASDKVLHDMFFWDNKIIAAYGRSIIFAVLSGGVEAWNLDDVNDAEFITSVADGHIHFIGTAEAPHGEPAVFFTDERRLYYLDFFARKSYQVDMGLTKNINASCIWNGALHITDGWNVMVYDPGGQTVRNIGFPRKDGIPPSIRNATNEFLITHLVPSDTYLYAVVEGGNNCWLYCYNGLGWHQIGAQMSGIYANVAFQASYPPVGAVLDRRLHVVGAATPTTVGITVHNFHLPNLSHIPVVDINIFGNSGARWYTGWIDGGFNELSGALLRLFIDAFNLSATETVKAEYQLDNDEGAAWTSMVDSLNVAAVFSNTTSTLYFSATTPKRGIQFRTVRFRFTINRGGVETKSPEIKALTLVYLKKPEFRSSWQFQIDINRMIEADTTYAVDGAPATMALVWAKIRSLWNTQTLLPLVIPNIEPSPGINVLISDAPMTFDDFRGAVDGQGFVSLQCLEPVSR